MICIVLLFGLSCKTIWCRVVKQFLHLCRKLRRAARGPRPGSGLVRTYRDAKGKRRFQGVVKRLKESQVYPLAFGKEELWQHSRDRQTSTLNLPSPPKAPQIPAQIPQNMPDPFIIGVLNWPRIWSHLSLGPVIAPNTRCHFIHRPQSIVMTTTHVFDTELTFPNNVWVQGGSQFPDLCREAAAREPVHR